MGTYVDGFVIPVPKGKKDEYEKIAKLSAEIFHDYGAIETYESWDDDVKKGKITDFYRSVDAKDDEAIVFALIIWPSKEVRDNALAKATQDHRFKEFDPSGVIDASRMILGGFKTFLHHKN